MAPLLAQALRDAVRYNEQLLKSETLRNKSDCEQYFVDITQPYLIQTARTLA